MAQESSTDFPKGVGAPALRALAAAGYTELAQLADVPAADLRQLHGMGPKALARLQQALAEHGRSPDRALSEDLTRVADMRTSRLRVTLRDVEPSVVRVIDVPASCLLPELHHLLQAAMGWTNSHLHQFVTGDLTYGVADLDADLDDERDESKVRLLDLPTRFTYLYDFGDDWEHDVEVLGSGADEPGIRYGEGACPPEDCGGPPGYARLLAVLADPADKDHLEMQAWAGDLADFDQQATDLLVRQTVGAVPGAVRLVLDLAKGGVKLTPGGRLPRVFVRQVQERLPQWSLISRPASIEEDLLPLPALHEMLRQVGLLRLRNGIVTPTRAAGDDIQVVRRLRSWFVPNEFTDVLTGVAVAELAATGPHQVDQLAARTLRHLGHGWGRDGHPLTQDDVRKSIYQHNAVWRGLELLEIDWPLWRAGPGALTLLPRATSLAQLWSLRPEQAS